MYEAGAVGFALRHPHLLWDFDHNGVFHLAQLAAIAFLGMGLRRILHRAQLEEI